MSEEKDDIKKIQKSIDDILGVESGLAKKRPTVKAKKREHFNTILSNLAHVNARSMGLKHDYKVDFMEYDDPFFNIIESLMTLHFNKAQKSLIEWWLYDKFLPTGEMLILKDQDTGEEIPTDTPDELWILVQQYEKKIISKDMIERAMKHTKSNMSAARFLGCSYPHYKQYAKLYKNEEGKTLFEAHLNRQGRGISKHLYKKKDLTPIMDILEGRVDIANYSPKDIKERLIHESLIAEECHSCGFNERRVVDYKVPLILNFIDGNAKNWKLENLELLCYNCYFLNVGNVWSDNQLQQMEDHNQKNKFNNDPTPDWEMDESHIEHLKGLGLWDEKEDGEQYIDFT